MKYVASRTKDDCGIAGLAMLTGQPYVHILELAAKINKDLSKGLTAIHIKYMLDCLEFPFKYYESSLDIKTANDALIGVRQKCLFNYYNIKIEPKSNDGHALIWNSTKKCFWCPSVPPLGFLRSLFSASEKTKNYYSSLYDASLKEPFFVFEKST
jgi:hypothetical protein